MDGNASFSRLVCANSSAVSVPANRPDQITILRGENEAWFLVNSIADKRIPWRRHMPSNRVSRTTRSDNRGRRLFLFSIPNLLTRRLPRTSTIPAAYPFFHIAEYKLCPLSTNSDLGRPISSGSTRRWLRIYMRRYHACNKTFFFSPRSSIRVNYIYLHVTNCSGVRNLVSRQRSPAPDNETNDFVWDLGPKVSPLCLKFPSVYVKPTCAHRYPR